MVSFGGNSRRSLQALRKEMDLLLTSLSAADCSAISADLYLVLRTLDSSVALRRALTDPSHEASAKVSLGRDLFNGKIGEKALKLVEVAASLRWSTSGEFADAIEQIAVECEASAANLNNEIDQVQTQLFEFSRVIDENYELRLALSDPRANEKIRTSIIDDIFGKLFNASTIKLIKEAATTRTHRTVEKGVEAVVYGVSARRNRVSAVVTSATALDQTQTAKLIDVLSKKVGQPVHLNFEIDPTVIGGLSVRFQDEVIDGSISARLEDARRVVTA